MGVIINIITEGLGFVVGFWLLLTYTDDARQLKRKEMKNGFQLFDGTHVRHFPVLQIAYPLYSLYYLPQRHWPTYPWALALF